MPSLPLSLSLTCNRRILSEKEKSHEFNPKEEREIVREIENLCSERRSAVELFDVVLRGEQERTVVHDRKVRESAINALEHWKAIVKEDDIGPSGKAVKKNILALWVRATAISKATAATATGGGGGAGDDARNS